MTKKIDTLIQKLVAAAVADAMRTSGTQPELAQALLDAKNAIKSQFREAGDKVAMYRNSLNAAEGKIRHLTPPVKPTQYVPFDMAKAKLGDDIEVLDTGLATTWRKAKFLTVTSQGYVISETSGTTAASQHVPSRVRVAKKSRELQLFVNVTRAIGAESMRGAVFTNEAQAMAVDGMFPGSHIAVAQPVTVTVVE